MTKLAIALLALSFQACAHGPQRIEKPIEGWRIDPNDATLYRVVSPVTEDFMKIKGNPDVRKLQCFEDDELVELMLRTKHE